MTGVRSEDGVALRRQDALQGARGPLLIVPDQDQRRSDISRVSGSCLRRPAIGQPRWVTVIGHDSPHSAGVVRCSRPSGTAPRMLVNRFRTRNLCLPTWDLSSPTTGAGSQQNLHRHHTMATAPRACGVAAATRNDVASRQHSQRLHLLGHVGVRDIFSCAATNWHPPPRIRHPPSHDGKLRLQS
jgi:hypothetical protein